MKSRGTNLIFGGILVGLVSIIVGLTSFIVSNSLGQVGENTKTINNTTEILRIVVAVTGCTIEDTPESCRKKLADNSTAEGARRITEVDCITRRALAGLPAPNSSGTCASQTPPEVYPGTMKKQPTRTP